MMCDLNFVMQEAPLQGFWPAPAGANWKPVLVASRWWDDVRAAREAATTLKESFGLLAAFAADTMADDGRDLWQIRRHWRTALSGASAQRAAHFQAVLLSAWQDGPERLVLHPWGFDLCGEPGEDRSPTYSEESESSDGGSQDSSSASVRLRPRRAGPPSGSVSPHRYAGTALVG